MIARGFRRQSRTHIVGGPIVDYTAPLLLKQGQKTLCLNPERNAPPRIVCVSEKTVRQKPVKGRPPTPTSLKTLGEDEENPLTCVREGDEEDASTESEIEAYVRMMDEVIDFSFDNLDFQSETDLEG